MILVSEKSKHKEKLVRALGLCTQEFVLNLFRTNFFSSNLTEAINWYKNNYSVSLRFKLINTNKKAYLKI